MKLKKMLRTSTIITWLTIMTVAFNACSPLKEFMITPTYQQANNFNYQLPLHDSLKKTVIIVANNDGTEFHVLDSVSFSNTDLLRFNPGEIVKYNGNFVNKNFLIKQLF